MTARIRPIPEILADIHAVRVNLADCPSTRTDPRSTILHRRLNDLLDEWETATGRKAPRPARKDYA